MSDLDLGTQQVSNAINQLIEQIRSGMHEDPKQAMMDAGRLNQVIEDARINIDSLFTEIDDAGAEQRICED